MMYKALFLLLVILTVTDAACRQQDCSRVACGNPYCGRGVQPTYDPCVSCCPFCPMKKESAMASNPYTTKLEIEPFGNHTLDMLSVGNVALVRNFTEFQETFLERSQDQRNNDERRYTGDDVDDAEDYDDPANAPADVNAYKSTKTIMKWLYWVDDDYGDFDFSEANNCLTRIKKLAYRKAIQTYRTEKKNSA
ncbi:Insect toxin mu-NPTX-Nc1a like protein [Argiope bruennichi]|uniref:Insect toxin mu-NPTX-Nc1a like protein n=1 Tax=Argiope bruennichi TaxID=94029 RepID=A0A8T0EZ55_ARGBR|nr:Insect toxin mu-NPTX-Nc1a like protein [Argiope bruennichi]